MYCDAQVSQHENDFSPHSTVQYTAWQKGAGRTEVSGAVHGAQRLGIAFGTTTDRERRGSALPVTRTRPRTTRGESEVLGDEIAGRDEKGAILH